MELKCLSEERGIFAIFQGYKKGYIIWSSYYGVVAIAENLEASENYDKVIINFDICSWNGYWSLRDIISRGVRKMERRWKPDKKVIINYKVVEGFSMTNIADIKIDIEKKY